MSDVEKPDPDEAVREHREAVMKLIESRRHVPAITRCGFDYELLRWEIDDIIIDAEVDALVYDPRKGVIVSYTAWLIKIGQNKVKAYYRHLQRGRLYAWNTHHRPSSVQWRRRPHLPDDCHAAVAAMRAEGWMDGFRAWLLDEGAILTAADESTPPGQQGEVWLGDMVRVLSALRAFLDTHTLDNPNMCLSALLHYCYERDPTKISEALNIKYDLVRQNLFRFRKFVLGKTGGDG